MLPVIYSGFLYIKRLRQFLDYPIWSLLTRCAAQNCNYAFPDSCPAFTNLILHSGFFQSSQYAIDWWWLIRQKSKIAQRVASYCVESKIKQKVIIDCVNTSTLLLSWSFHAFFANWSHINKRFNGKSPSKIWSSTWDCASQQFCLILLDSNSS